MTNTEFVNLMFSNAVPGALPWVTAFTSAPFDASRGEWAGWPVRRRLSIPRNVRSNTYVVVSSFIATEAGYRRRKANFSAMHCVMVDDISVKVPESSIALPFTVEVETSPDNRQGWYRLDPPVADRALGERLIERMIAAGLTADGKDPGMKGVTRYGRLPEGSNNKPTVVARCGGPWRHLVTACRPDLSYTVDEIAAAYGLDLTPPAPRLPTIVRTSVPPECASVLDWLRTLGLYRERLGNGWHAITCPWVSAHSGRAPTGTAYAEPSEHNNFVGGFKCHHGHCETRDIGDLLRFFDAVINKIEEVQCRTS